MHALDSLPRLAGSGPVSRSSWRAPWPGGTDLSPAARELASKLRLFAEFTGADLARQDRRPHWPTAGELGPFAGAAGVSVWQAEGMAFSLGARSPAPRALRAWLTSLPTWCHRPVHAGLGLAEALTTLGQIHPSEGPSAARRPFERLLERAGAWALAGQLETAVEPLGFAGHNMSPQAFRALDASLPRQDRLRRLLWHGVGRGLYFTPSAFVADGPTAARRAARSAPDIQALSSLWTGWAFALTLVNLAHPAAIATSLTAGDPVPVATQRCWALGLVSATAAWEQMSGSREATKRLWRHRPAEPTAAHRWAELAEACRQVRARAAGRAPYRLPEEDLR